MRKSSFFLLPILIAMAAAPAAATTSLQRHTPNIMNGWSYDQSDDHKEFDFGMPGSTSRFNQQPLPSHHSGPQGDDCIEAAVPEPSSWMLLLTGFMAMGGMLRTGRRKSRPSFGIN